jgi:hypothetical protein
MLSPFLAHLLEHTLVFKLYAINSKQKDTGTLNQAAAALGSTVSWFTGTKVRLSRGEILSAYQQQKANELYEHIIAINQDTSNDSAVYLSLKAKIASMLSDLKEQIKVHKGPNQTTSLLIELQRFQKRLEVARQYFQENALFDQPFNGTAMIVFNTGLCNYMVNKTVYLHAIEIGYYTYTGYFRTLGYDVSLSSQKDVTVRQYLAKKDYPDTSPTGILPFINDVMKQDTDLIERHTIEGSFPLKIGMLQWMIPIRWIYTPKTLAEEMQSCKNILKLESFTNSPVTFLANNNSSTPSIPAPVIVEPPVEVKIIKHDDNDDDDDDENDFDTVEQYYSGDEGEDKPSLRI